MKFKFENQASGKATANALFFVKKSIQFSAVLSETGTTQAETVLEGMQDGPFEDLEYLEIDGVSTAFVNASKERGLSSLDHLRMAGYRLGQFAQKKQINTMSLMLADAAEEQVKAILHGLYYSEYSFDKYKSKPKKKFAVTYEIVGMEHTKEFQKVAAEVAIEQESITLARDLINTPGTDLPPEAFVAQAKKVAKELGLEIKVRNSTQLTKEGFTGINIVGKGSQFEPYMVTLTYKPSKAPKDKHFAIVGKGLTFDTGGISLKPAKGMWEMCSDMSGAAAALGAISAIAKLKLPIHVTAILCLCENRIGSKSMLPGDIFTAKNGKTVMIDNTDAEGRLALTDGFAEAGLVKATHLVDLATLTGAMVRSLGYAVTGFFSNDEVFARKVIEGGSSVCEKFWPMPLEDEYADEIKDKFADLCNSSPNVGAIAAALFLREFLPENIKWTHWDIAGTAFVTKPWKYTNHGATGIGVQTLIEIARRLGD
jgi:leucyl aminopeptidase